MSGSYSSADELLLRLARNPRRL